MRAHEEVVSRVAAEQHGAIARRQALEAGMSRRTFQRRVADGLFPPTGLPGVHRVAWMPVTWHQQLWAAQLWADERAAISHASAAALFELDHFEPGPVHITVAGGANHRASVTVHQSHVRDGDVRVLDGLRVTSPDRTIGAIA